MDTYPIQVWMYKHMPHVLDVYQRFTFVEWLGILIALGLLL
jgi:hypothetical protein